MRRISDIGAAVIGTGFIGTVHLEALRRIGVTVRGVLGSSPERGQARADVLGVRVAYPSLDDLLADDTVDVVHVTSPNDVHVEQSLAILRAGKHVVCEKPLAMTAEDSARLVVAAADSGLVNATNFNIRYYPLNQHAHELVAGGALGEVRLVTGRYFQDWLLHDTDWNWRLQPDRGGALRAVGDIGSHWLDLMTFVTGQRVAAVMAFFFVANYVVGFLAIFVLRRREPDLPRPYRAWGYPWTTVLALIVSLAFLAGAIAGDTRNSLFALLVLAASFPVYRLGRRLGWNQL